MVLLAYWCSLRIGELRGLRRRDIDLLHGWVDVREQVVDIGGRFVTGPPKTDAGRRRVAVPPHIRDEVARHLAEFVRADADAFVFTGHLGEGPVASATWRRSWNRARNATGLSHLHFHDLRHAGNTLASATGASTRELMARMGHASPRAALIYQHATSDRDQAIASAVSNLAAEAELRRIVPRDGRTMEAL
jgi:integrase